VFHEYVLASAPEFVRDRSEAEDRWARGEQDGTPLEDVIAEFNREQGAAGRGLPRALCAGTADVYEIERTVHRRDLDSAAPGYRSPTQR